MGLEIVLLPHPVDGARADLLGSRHGSTAPVRRAFWFGLQGGFHDGGHLLLAVRRLTAATRLNVPYAVQSLRPKAFAPQCRSMAVKVELTGNLQILFAI